MSTFAETVAALLAGQPAIFPTDTVYGLGVCPACAESPQVLFDLKRRPGGKPVAWLVGKTDDLQRFGCEVPDYAVTLAREFWPGALTLVVRATDAVPAAFASPEGTIGLRMPDSKTVCALVEELGFPLAATSANISGHPAPYALEEVSPELLEQVPAALDDVLSKSGVASTVVDCTADEPRILREGSITADQISQVLASSNSALSDKRCSACEEFAIPSADGKTSLRARLWMPSSCCSAQTGEEVASQPKGVIHVVHGMAEHIDRYDDFARFLVSRGYAVCGADMLGHGKSVSCSEELGCLPVSGGKEILLADVHALREAVRVRFGEGTPYVIFGHSMGSFIVRAYLARHGEGLAAAVLSGTGNIPVPLSKAGNLLARVIAAVKGVSHRSALLDGMGAGGYANKLDNPRTKVDWLSYNIHNVDAYQADALCGFMFSAGGYATLTDLTAEVAQSSSAGQIPADLPVLLVAGEGDPVGDFGKGVRAAANLFRQVGVRSVSCTIYSDMRHEILNEAGNRVVYEDVVEWIGEQL